MQFEDVVRGRRSCRLFTDEKVPEEVIKKALEMALLAPNSSNMQPWEFYWVRSPEKKAELVKACFSQPAASTAQELIVAVARRDTWKRNLKLMRDTLENNPQTPKAALTYYRKVVPLVYGHGPFGILGCLKNVAMFFVGLFRPVPRGFGNRELMQVLVKTTALACENFMLSIVDQGYASCPMEGFDEVRVKKVLGLGCKTRVVMCLGVGRPNPKGIYGPRLRHDPKLFIHQV